MDRVQGAEAGVQGSQSAPWGSVQPASADRPSICSSLQALNPLKLAALNRLQPAGPQSAPAGRPSMGSSGPALNPLQPALKCALCALCVCLQEKQERFMALVVPDNVDRVKLQELEAAQGHAFGRRRSSSGALPAPAPLIARAPSLGGALSSGGTEVPPSDLEGEYSWSKEYVYTIERKGGEAAENEGRQFFVRFRDGVASYCEIHTRLELKKRSDARSGAEDTQLARPSKVVVRARPPTEAEEAERTARLQRLKVPDAA
eukprot:355668-Chlamydomonas_euryale.AAC.8